MTTTNNTITPAFLTSTVKEPMNTRRSPAVYKGILFGLDTLPDLVPWAYEVVTDVELGGGPWSKATSNNRYIQRAVMSGWIRVKSLVPCNSNRPTRILEPYLLLLSTSAAEILGLSKEVGDYLMCSSNCSSRYHPNPIAAGKNLMKFGVPTQLYGLYVDVDPDNPEAEALLTTADRRMGIVIKVS